MVLALVALLVVLALHLLILAQDALQDLLKIQLTLVQAHHKNVLLALRIVIFVLLQILVTPAKMVSIKLLIVNHVSHAQITH